MRRKGASVCGFPVRTAEIAAAFALANGDKLFIMGHGYVSLDVGKGKTKTRMLLGGDVLVPDLTSNLLFFRAVDRNHGAVVLVDNAWYILSDGDAVRLSGVLDVGL